MMTTTFRFKRLVVAAVFIALATCGDLVFGLTDRVEIEGPLSEAGDMGYYAIGPHTSIMLVPESPDDKRVQLMLGANVRVTIEVMR